jgi:transposase
MKTKERRARKTKSELEALKSLAYEWFMNADKTQKEIAEIIGVSEATMSTWSSDGRWDELKALERASRGGTVRNLMKRIFEESQKDDPDADKISKLAASLEKLEQKKVTVPNIISVFMGFGSWLYKVDPDLAKKITSYQNQYVEEKISE